MPKAMEPVLTELASSLDSRPNELSSAMLKSSRPVYAMRTRPRVILLAMSDPSLGNELFSKPRTSRTSKNCMSRWKICYRLATPEFGVSRGDLNLLALFRVPTVAWD